MQYDSRKDQVKLGIGRGGDASSYQTGSPERDARMFFKLRTPDAKKIETKIKDNAFYEFDHEWTKSEFIEDIKKDIIALHNMVVEDEDNYNYKILDGWDFEDKITYNDLQRKLILAHAEELANQIDTKGYLLHPILITKDYKITDGQHRFEALKILRDKGKRYEMPLIMNEKSTVDDFIAANVGKKNLKPVDYVRPYAIRKKPGYSDLLEKLKIYDDINSTVVIRAYSMENSSKYKAGEFVLGDKGDTIMKIIIEIDKKYDFNAKKSAWSNSINKIYRLNHKRIDIQRLIDRAPLDLQDIASETDIKQALIASYDAGLDTYKRLF